MRRSDRFHFAHNYHLLDRISKYTINPIIGKKKINAATPSANNGSFPLRIASRYAHTIETI